MSYKCARCGTSGKSLTLSFFFLCDSCTARLTTEAFNNNGPVFEGYQVKGYCYLCANFTDVKLRQWILCEDCSRVVHSYPIGMLAQRCVLTWLKSNIPWIKFELTDPVILMPYSRRKVGKRPQPDITGYDDKGNKVLMIEVKTGRSSISDMGSFQLDVSDCDDILEYVKREQIATYIFHVQVVEMFAPPTSYFRCAGVWWTNIFELSECFQYTRKRRIDRGKEAAYYDPRCFKSVDLFIEEVKKRKYEALTERLRKGSIPALYKLKKS
jgi:hypothetical protein